MAQLEKNLLYLKKHHGLIALKVDMESECVSIEEIKLFKSFANDLNIKFVMKIGGCGSVSQLLECKEVGADIIVAPMIESSYAIEKFIQTCKKVYFDTQLPKLHVNIETIEGVNNFNKIISNHTDEFSAIVFGRSDFTGSIKSTNANSNEVFNYINEIKNRTEKLGKDFIVGGSLNSESISFIKKLKPTFVETRNLVFQPNITEETIKSYIDFEIMWLTTKKTKTKLDAERISELQRRRFV